MHTRAHAHTRARARAHTHRQAFCSAQTGLARRGKASSVSTVLPLRGSRLSKVVHGRAPPWAPESVLLLLEIGHYRRNQRPCNTKAMRMSVLLTADKASTHAWTQKHALAVATQGVFHGG